MKSLLNRLEIIRERLHLTQAEFAIKGNTKRTNYTTWLSKNSSVPSDFIWHLKKNLPTEIDLNWLFTGHTLNQVSEAPSGYNQTDCEAKLAMAEQLINTQALTIELLKSKVSASVTDSPYLQTQTS